MKVKTKIQTLRTWLTAIMIALPVIMLAEPDNSSTVEIGENNAVLQAANPENPSLRGWRTFIDISLFSDPTRYDPDCTDCLEDPEAYGNKWNVSASYGYQFSNHIYLGIGAALDYNTYYKRVGVPFFADLRINILDNRSVEPYINIRLGYSVGKLNGTYCSGTFGARIRHTATTAFYVGIGMDVTFSPKDNGIDPYLSVPGLRVGYEF